MILAVGTRFPETDSSSWEGGVTFQIPPTRLIHVDIDPHEPGRNYPAFIAATADAALALRAIADAYGEPTPERGYDWARLRNEREAFLAPSRENAASDEFPLLPERILADVRRGDPRRDPRDGRGLEQERRRPAVPGRQPGLLPDPRRLLDDGVRPGGRPGRRRRPPPAARPSRSSATAPSVRTRASSRPRWRWEFAPIWVVMNNSAFGTIAGLQRKHYGTGYGCEFEADGSPYTAGLRRRSLAPAVPRGSASRARPSLEPALRSALQSGAART